MILAGAWLITRLHWLLRVFGAFLLFSGIMMYWFADDQADLESNALILWLRLTCRSAVNSPVTFAITIAPFIVLNSKLFAILGLCTMYFLPAGVAKRLSLLKYALAAVLVLIGTRNVACRFVSDTKHAFAGDCGHPGPSFHSRPGNQKDPRSPRNARPEHIKSVNRENN